MKFLTVTHCCYCSNPCVICGTKIQTFKDFNGDFWRLDDSKNNKSSTAHSILRSVYDYSVDFPQSRIAFAFALSCYSEIQNAAVCNCGRCIQSFEERRFPHVAYVTTYTKALLLVRRKKERERILLRAE